MALMIVALVAATSPGLAPAQAPDASIPIVLSTTAKPSERSAAADLAKCLQQIYPRERFLLADRLPDSGTCILVGNVASDSAMLKHVRKEQLQAPESYVVATANDGGRRIGVIAGADERGTAYGVYALLEKLGCGFYLSYDALPPARQSPFDFDGWDMADRPLVRERFVFNWHNFLSGCSTWNLDDWRLWIGQSRKMGFNGIMVHAYGNNPMAHFRFNGQSKPVGYLSTTIKGRDWSTMHVNDVRRLYGGIVFDGPAFGAQAGLVADDRRVEAAQGLMRDVFADAREQGMNVYFALDVDTVSANPQSLIETLPPDARFAIENAPGASPGKFWLVNPDTPEGYRYYKAQFDALLDAYPQITTLVLWFRTGATPWTALKISEMPPQWQQEYKAELARKSGPRYPDSNGGDAAKEWQSHNMFAISKIVRACERALKESGRENIELAVGSWNFNFLPACDRFMPGGVKLIPLDYGVLRGESQLRDADSRRVIRAVGEHRVVLPVAWAHHDDGAYIGRPFTPYSEFHSRLEDAKAGGFGIIHWTTRPLDLYFKSLSEQVWESRKDRPLRATCDDMAERSFGAAARAPMGEYLERWVTEAPSFARETGDRFIDRQLTDIDKVVAGCRERLRLIDRAATGGLTFGNMDRLTEAQARVAYFHLLEEFIAAFFEAHGACQDSQARLKEGDLAAARAAMAGFSPEGVIDLFAGASSLGGVTRGEQGLVVSMNLRWLTHIARHRQALGLEPVRFNFAPTSHDPLAQSPGAFTFHFDRRGHIWECLGSRETGCEVFALPADTPVTRAPEMPEDYEEICRTGIEIARPMTLPLRPFMTRGNQDSPALPAGNYRVRLLMLDAVSTASGRRVFDVSMEVKGDAESEQHDRVDIFQSTGRPNAILERVFVVSLPKPGMLQLTLTPREGKAILCGGVVEPVSRLTPNAAQ
jgi:hypothetical protein